VSVSPYTPHRTFIFRQYLLSQLLAFDRMEDHNFAAETDILIFDRAALLLDKCLAPQCSLFFDYERFRLK
jgi:hypothetical protein